MFIMFKENQFLKESHSELLCLHCSKLGLITVQIVVIEDRKKAIEEKDEDETKETETNVFTNWSSSKRNELTVDKALMKETQVTTSNFPTS